MEQIIYAEKTDGISIDRIRRDAAFSMPRKHLHNEYEIYYLLEGERYYFIDRRTCHVTGGSLVFIDRNQIHQTSQAGPCSHERILISLDPSPFSEFLSSTGEMSLPGFFRCHSGILTLDTEEQVLAECLLDDAAKELHEKKTGFRHMAMSNLSRLFILAQRHMSGSSLSPVLPLSTQPKHRKVDEVASYIIGHYDNRLSLEMIAEHFYVNKCYLSRIFKEVSGFTVNEYINMIRIRRARELLSGSSMSITEVPESVGFEKKGEVAGVTVIDDYAHHPQEIKATLAAARNYPHRKLWCVFQPHTYTRTRAFLDQFAEALSAADEVVLADIYAARETDTLGVSSRDVADRIEKLGTKAHYIPSFDEIETFILENCMNGDLLITMGAGDIVKVGEKLLGQ